MPKVKVKPLEWRIEPPVGQDGDPGDEYALGVGGDYCLKVDGCLFWVEDPFTFAIYQSRKSAKEAAQRDHEKRVLALLL